MKCGLFMFNQIVKKSFVFFMSLKYLHFFHLHIEKHEFFVKMIFTFYVLL